MINSNIALCCSMTLNVLLLSLLFFRRQIRIEIRPYRPLRAYIERRFQRNKSTQADAPTGFPVFVNEQYPNYVYPYCDANTDPIYIDSVIQQYLQQESLTYAGAAMLPPQMVVNTSTQPLPLQTNYSEGNGNLDLETKPKRARRTHRPRADRSTRQRSELEGVINTEED